MIGKRDNIFTFVEEYRVLRDFRVIRDRISISKVDETALVQFVCITFAGGNATFCLLRFELHVSRYML